MMVICAPSPSSGRPLSRRRASATQLKPALARNDFHDRDTVESPPLDTPLTITLDPDEALVLFEFLWRYEQEERLVVEDPAEGVVLTRLLGTLERHLVAPFDARFVELLGAARARIRGPGDGAAPPAS